ncbi:Fes1-domain-containing protein [Coniophora puteana RWD-64-598 SS2]|uniref:Fes1-domain-containing protein n=1 Tax=Coniophora puteana (strain RWD-64-598) TaxID=741705 RepID=A0A5M3MCE4_CONPW|nr:Fes1-domain-containing protein [Coniophora puteana RWD-64-598 SS2]EIW76574.1 Fes1-domain-containing protein [Coniophora puteana RWD-64-598 SS2]
MDSLLRWGIQNSTQQPESEGAAPVQRRDLDPAIIDHILGKPDAQLMREALACAVDTSRDEDARLTALEDFQMLVENIDNANDLKKMNMWQPIQDLLLSPESSDDIKTNTLWIIGIAIQNNPSAQSAYLALDPIPQLLPFLSPSTNSRQARSKAVFTLSSLLKHSAAAIQQFDAHNGWSAFRACLEDSDISVRRKTAFLMNTLLLPTHDAPPASASAPTGTEAGVGSTAAALHTSSSPSAPPSHPNSHSAIVDDPASASTSATMLRGLRSPVDPDIKKGDSTTLLDAVVEALVRPVPFGPDGEHDRDVGVTENLVKCASVSRFSLCCLYECLRVSV